MSDQITLTLAHPLNARQVERLHAKDVRDYLTGEKIVVPRNDARAIINAGFAAGVEPGNAEQVNKALSVPVKNATKSSS